ncbi:MAG TPA: hypothetical protein VGM63_24910, partial [Mucilaginibacter sp.]
MPGFCWSEINHHVILNLFQELSGQVAELATGRWYDIQYLFFYLCPMTICAGLDFNFLDQDLVLLPQKAIYWKQQKVLIAADVHMGKVGHFRKAGIAVPRNMEQSDLATLSDLIFEHQPEKLIFLGDLFH